MPMRFSVDAHAIGQRLTGNEVYIRSLLHGFSQLNPDAEFVAYLSEPDVNGWVPSYFQKRVVAKNRYLRLGYDLAGCVRRDRPDLIHVQYNAPLFCPAPIVVTVHDVSFIEHPEYFPAGQAWQLRFSTGRTLRYAAKVITVSEFSRQRMTLAYGIPKEDIIVTPLAAQPHFRPINRSQAVARLRDRFGINHPFLLTVGDLQPRKNQVGLIAAFRELVAEHPQLPHVLVMAGKETWFAPHIREEIRRSGLGSRIFLTGFVSEEDLLDLYNGADLFVFPSFYEGFGLPVIEAMACGRAVISSSTSSLPEVADAAGILIDPRSKLEIVRAMRDVLLDAELRERLERHGLQRAAAFSWKETARRTLEAYYSVARKRQRHLPSRQEPLRVGRS